MDDSCSALTSAGKLLQQTPPGWVEAGNQPWGSVVIPGWQLTVGSGRLFTGRFLQNQVMEEIQEATRAVHAELLGCHASKLVRIPERASVKPVGAKELKTHLDLDPTIRFGQSAGKLKCR